MKDSTTRVFISYATPDRLKAQWLREALSEVSDIKVVMDDDFQRGMPVIANIGAAITDQTIVLAVITEDYLDRHFTELEVSVALVHGSQRLIPLVSSFALQPMSEVGRNIWTVIKTKTCVTVDWIDPNPGEIIASVQRLASTHQSPQTALTSVTGSIQVAYDWEDSARLESVGEALSSLGASAVTFHPASEAFSSEAHRERVDWILWTEGASASPDVAGLGLKDPHVGFLITEGAPEAPSPRVHVNLPGLDQRRALSTTGPRLRSRGPSRVTPVVQASEALLRANRQIPINVIGDRFCQNPAILGLAREAYYLGQRLPAGNPVRMQATLDYGASLRFFGAWERAHDVLFREPNEVDSAIARSLVAELLSLEFEMGRVADMQERAYALLSKCLHGADWANTISLHRLLGMLFEEQGSYSEARNHFTRAYTYADDLGRTLILAQSIKSEIARDALHIDCLRELAALESKTGNASRGAQLLDRAFNEAARLADDGLRAYVESTLRYQRARATYRTDRAYEPARREFEHAYRTLQRFGNPIRLAAVLDASVQLEMHFIQNPAMQYPVLLPLLEKLQRVRHNSSHDFMLARTQSTLGNLEFASGHWTKAREWYESAHEQFTRLGKLPESTKTARALARCLVRQQMQDDALDTLQDALEDLTALDMGDLKGVIMADIARVSRDSNRQIVIDEATQMTGVGEFGMHTWMRERLLDGAQGSDLPHVPVGLGDDGAVLDLDAGIRIVLTTDSTPAVLLEDRSLPGAKYAARFAVLSAASDVLAMGGTPLAILLNLHVRRDTPAHWAQELLSCAAAEAASIGALVVGGDLKERAHASLTTTAVGSVNDHVLLRSGAKDGDLLVLTLSGRPGTGFRGLGRRWAQELVPYLTSRERLLIESLVVGNAKMEDFGLPTEVMAALAARKSANAAIDTSDGILACAQLLGLASNLSIELYEPALSELVAPEVSGLAEVLGIEPFLFALNAGHDWEIAMSVSSSRLHELRDLTEGGSPRLAVIGKFSRREKWADEGVALSGPRLPLNYRIPYFTDEKFVPVPYEDRAHEWLEYAREVSRDIAEHKP